MLALDLNTLAGGSLEASKSLKVKSAMNPALWAAGVICPPLLVMAFFSDDNILRYSSMGIVALISIAVVGLLIYFAIAMPEKLQSEDYQLRRSAQ